MTESQSRARSTKPSSSGGGRSNGRHMGTCESCRASPLMRAQTRNPAAQPVRGGKTRRRDCAARRTRAPQAGYGCAVGRRGGQHGDGEERHNPGAFVCLLYELEHLDGGVGGGLDVEVAAFAQDPRHGRYNLQAARRTHDHKQAGIGSAWRPPVLVLADPPGTSRPTAWQTCSSPCGRQRLAKLRRHAVFHFKITQWSLREPNRIYG